MLSSSTRFLLISAFTAFALLVSVNSVRAQTTSGVIRILTPLLSDTFDDLYHSSPTGRAIVDELEQSDLIVYVKGMGLDYRPRLVGTMQFVHAAGGRRFLRVTINERFPADRRVAALAHELQHALEVARATSVVDVAGVADLYRTIGHAAGGDPSDACYETDAARLIERRALDEFRMAGSQARRSRIMAAAPPR